jgi:hypothetical protein
MRNEIVILTLMLLSGPVKSATGQTLPADVGPGRIAWFDLSTANLQRSTDFYRQVFDWQFRPVQGTDQAVEIVAGGSLDAPRPANILAQHAKFIAVRAARAPRIATVRGAGASKSLGRGQGVTCRNDGESWR